MTEYVNLQEEQALITVNEPKLLHVKVRIPSEQDTTNYLSAGFSQAVTGMSVLNPLPCTRL